MENKIGYYGHNVTWEKKPEVYRVSKLLNIRFCAPRQTAQLSPRSTKFASKPLVTMRADHLPFLRVGATVTAKATFFDDNIDNRWSEAVYGEAWATAVVPGVVTRQRDGLVLVRFEDGDTLYMHPDDLELSGDALRRAEKITGRQDVNGESIFRAVDEMASGDDATNGEASDEAEDDESDVDEPLATMATRHLPIARDGTSGSSGEPTEGSKESTPSLGKPRRGRGRGRGRGKAGGSRGRGRRARSRPDSATIPTSMAGVVEIENSDDASEDEEDGEEEGDEAGSVIKMANGQVWKKGVGRTVNPFLQRGYRQGAKLRLPGCTEKNEMEYFLACFPKHLIEMIAQLMTQKGRTLQFGTSWIVTPGEVYTFFGYNVAIMLLHTGGPKQDLWLASGDINYDGALFLAPDLGQYGLSFNKFQKLMMTFTVPTYGDGEDPFDPIRLFVDAWNKNMENVLLPGPTIIVDESMGLWKGRGMPGLMVVARKPTPVGRESHTTADGDTSCIIFVEPYEGKERMQHKEWVQEWGKAPATAMRCVKPWMGTGRLVIADAGFASLKLATGLAEHGTYLIGNVKGGHSGFPKAWLLEQVPERGCRAAASTTILTSAGETWEVVAAADRDKQPMVVIGTAGTTSMGEELVRHFTVIRSDGTFHVRSASLEQWDIHATYRKHFNAIDKHNSKRQGGSSFEDSWKTHKWWVRDFQMLFGMSEVNAFLLWRKFRPGGQGHSMDFFRRRLAHQLLHNHIRRAELGEGMNLRDLGGNQHVVQLNGAKTRDGKTYRGTCSYCNKRTVWSCSCAPCLDGMSKHDRAQCMYLCSFTQNPECFYLHARGLEASNKRALAAATSWAARKSRARA